MVGNIEVSNRTEGKAGNEMIEFCKIVSAAHNVFSGDVFFEDVAYQEVAVAIEKCGSLQEGFFHSDVLKTLAEHNQVIFSVRLEHFIRTFEDFTVRQYRTNLAGEEGAGRDTINFIAQIDQSFCCAACAAADVEDCLDAVGDMGNQKIGIIVLSGVQISDIYLKAVRPEAIVQML